MAIDPKQLQRDARSFQKVRRRQKGDGTTAAIRAALPIIYKLRAEGVLWSEIAAALGKQGVTQGSGKKRTPITTNRLTSIMRQIEQEIERADQPKSRQPSIKNRQTPQNNALQNRSVSLALELKAQVKPSEARTTPNEEDLRRAALDKIQGVLKKD